MAARSDYFRKWYAAHRARVLAQQKEWQAKHPDKVAEYKQRWNSKNAEKRRTYLNEYSRTYSPKWRRNNRAKVRAWTNKWHAANRDKINAAQRRRYAADPTPANLKCYKRRSLARNAEGSFTTAEWHALCARFNHCCAKCGRRRKLTKDHIVPLSKGGSNYIQNIQPLCKPCNSKKKNH